MKPPTRYSPKKLIGLPVRILERLGRERTEKGQALVDGFGRGNSLLSRCRSAKCMLENSPLPPIFFTVNVNTNKFWQQALDKIRERGKARP